VALGLHTRLAQYLPRQWYRQRLNVVLWPLLPFSWLFQLLVCGRRFLYRNGIFHSHRLSAPLIVVGNLTVGGTGKTPLVLWLLARLREQGWQPGVITRGYGGSTTDERQVLPASTATEVGDEPLLLARRSGVPVFIGRDRVAAGRALLAAYPACDVIVADDGLQHYRLQRCFELVVFGEHGAGNGCLLPAGPLREPLSRLSDVSKAQDSCAVIWHGSPTRQITSAAQALPQFVMHLGGHRFVALTDTQRVCEAVALRGRRLYAIAGIGDPARFFQQLSALGLEFSAHPFPDHHAYCADELAFARDGVLLMTEKDAVKCAALTPGALGEAWYLPVEAEIGPNVNAHHQQADLLKIILEKLNGRTPA
jgi:tetraacyldisaccharide 4'-kinase